jgi:hypothetical protein
MKAMEVRKTREAGGGAPGRVADKNVASPGNLHAMKAHQCVALVSSVPIENLPAVAATAVTTTRTAPTEAAFAMPASRLLLAGQRSPVDLAHGGGGIALGEPLVDGRTFVGTFAIAIDLTRFARFVAAKATGRLVVPGLLVLRRAGRTRSLSLLVLGRTRRLRLLRLHRARRTLLLSVRLALWLRRTRRLSRTMVLRWPIRLLVLTLLAILLLLTRLRLHDFAGANLVEGKFSSFSRAIFWPMNFSMSRTWPRSSATMMVKASPVACARPVRPMRCT